MRISSLVHLFGRLGLLLDGVHVEKLLSARPLNWVDIQAVTDYMLQLWRVVLRNRRVLAFDALCVELLHVLGQKGRL